MDSITARLLAAQYSTNGFCWTSVVGCLPKFNVAKIPASETADTMMSSKKRFFDDMFTNFKLSKERKEASIP
ncbi:hypothetical protein [Rosistilla ulvae]|uniref:hypothetical protein n=1 Tax=Rosistilla ulvae TaxID=1930277 RepID=UPI001C54FAC2|nr:hypothetical protein [Rosistilla ulvae]